MKKAFFYKIILLFAAACLHGEKIEIVSDGMFQIDLNGIPVMRNDTMSLSGAADGKTTVDLKKGEGIKQSSAGDESVRIWNSEHSALKRTIAKGADHLAIAYDYSLEKGMDGKSIVLSLHIPKACMDSAPASIPTGKFNKPITLHTMAGLVTLDPAGSSGGEWVLEDLRQFDWCKRFRLQFRGGYDPLAGSKGRAELSVRLVPEVFPAFVQIPLNPAASRGFADGADHSGWTGQGANNDLSTMPSGLLYCAGIPFDVTGKAILLRGRQTPDFPLSSGIMALPQPIRCTAFYFLQTAAWATPESATIATYHIRYQDGTTASIPVRYLRDVADWWAGADVVNARIAWSGNNTGGQRVTVYMMRAVNPFPEKAVIGIELISEDQTCTLALIAATAVRKDLMTEDQIAELNRIYNYSKSHSQTLDTTGWKPCPIAWKGGIEPESALDFSFLNHKPAGKYGFLKRVGDHFEFEKQPGVPVRFWGTNFAIEGAFPDKELVSCHAIFCNIKSADGRIEVF